MKLHKCTLQLSLTLLVLCITSCRKKHSDPQPKDMPETVKISSAYTTTEQAEFNKLSNLCLTLFSRKNIFVDSICGATIQDISTGSYVGIKYTFDSSIVCGSSSIRRSGTVYFLLDSADQWTDRGAVATIKFENYRVYSLSDTSSGRSVGMAGTVSRKNITGGSISNMSASDSLVQDIYTNNLVYTYEDGTAYSQHISERITSRNAISGIETSITGTGIYNGTKGITIWGKTKDNKVFYQAITSPKIYNTCSGDSKFIKGRLVNRRGPTTIEEIYGVNMAGTPVNDCSAVGYLSIRTNADGQQYRQVFKY